MTEETGIIIDVPNVGRGTSYIKTIKCELKVKDGIFKIYDSTQPKDSRESQSKEVTGIIIGFGYQFKKTISASVKKSVARESRIYSNNLFSTMSMPIIEEVRTTTKEGSIYDRKQVGTVTEKFVESIESKDDPMKMNKVMIIYMLDPKNIDGLLIGVQVQGQARYHIENNKLITSRSANYITTISLPDEPSKVSDFGDVFLPDFKTGDRWDASIRSVVQEKVNSVHAFLNNISPTVEIDAPKELTADDIKNVFGDLPF